MKEHAIEVAKITPPASVALMTMQEWSILVVIIYTLILIFDKFFPGVLPKAGQWAWGLIKGIFRGKGQ